MTALAVIAVSLAVVVVASLRHVQVMDNRDREAIEREHGPNVKQAREVRELAQALWSTNIGGTCTKQEAFEKACRMKGFEPWGKGAKRDEQ